MKDEHITKVIKINEEYLDESICEIIEGEIIEDEIIEEIKKIKDNFCIICLEHMNDDIMKICDVCEVKCHINCLYDWYKKNNQELCPICLKKTGEISVINNGLYENSDLIQEYENIIERNNGRNNEINNGRNNETRDFEYRCLLFYIFHLLLLLFCIILIYMYTDI